MRVEIKSKLTEDKTIREQFLAHRGISQEWLETNNLLVNYGKDMYNFSKGKALIDKHKNSPTDILVDSDTDGYTSAAVTYLQLMDYGYTNVRFIMGEGKTHGIIMQIINPDTKFLIIPDASSSEIDKHKELSERGIDILILDHHEVEQEDNEYAVIINPHQAKCNYPNKALSGVGVVFKFFQQIDLMNGENFYEKYTDLVATGLVGDMMDISNMENKGIVNHGFAELRNRFLVELQKAHSRLDADNLLNAFSISFYIAPVINAVIRVGTAEDKMSMLEAMVGLKIPQTVIADILKVKRSQDTKKEPLIIRIVHDLQKTNRDKSAIIVATSPVNMPKSMTGLLAGQMANLYNRPALLGRYQDEVFVGSLRSLSGSSVENLKDFCEESGLFNWVAGHQSAAGFEMPKGNVEAFIAYADENLPPVEMKYNVDYKLADTLSFTKSNIVYELANFTNHYCRGFEQSYLLDEIVVTPNELEIIGKNLDTLKITKGDLEYMMFRQKNFEVPETIKLMRIVGKPSLNVYFGRTKPQIIIEDYEFLDLEL